MKNELIHEVWLDPEPDGQMLPGLCLAGPMGNDFRALLVPEAVKAAELRGHSHFDAMTKYWKLQGWGEYEAEYPQDHEHYPDEWAAIQRTFLDGRN
jgi:hypothetical protein